MEEATVEASSQGADPALLLAAWAHVSRFVAEVRGTTAGRTVVG
jgi:hypothetical protein